MTKAKMLLSLSAVALASGMSGTAIAQVAEPVVESAPAPAPAPAPIQQEATPPVAAPAPAPAPTVMPPKASDTVNPEALAQVQADEAERASEARAAAPTKVKATPRVTERPAAAEPAVGSSGPAAMPEPAQVADPVTDIAEPIPVAPPAEINAGDGEIGNADTPQPVDDWMIAAGVVGALGLAGAGAMMASRRRRKFVAQPRPAMAVEPLPAANEPEWKPATARAEPIAPRPIIQQPATAADPIFARQPRADAHVRDPMFNPSIRDRSNLPPVTDPMFARKVELPPVTDPLFANHPDYVGPGAKPQTIGTRHPEATRSWREMEPAE
jgi:hypothetical protein